MAEITKHVTKAVVILLGLGFSGQAAAFTFLPTDQEFNSWPAHCKAVYAKTKFGENTKFVAYVTQAQKDDLQRREGEGIFAPHHYCAGIIWLNRYNVESDARSRAFMLKQALAETLFTYRRSNKESSYFAEIAIQLAFIQYEGNEVDQAMHTLEDAIIAAPENAITYSALAILQRRIGALEDARDTLLAGDSRTKGTSAEINYNLGLICFELQEFSEAQTYADTAYKLGYPLQGLKMKLARLAEP